MAIPGGFRKYQLFEVLAIASATLPEDSMQISIVKICSDPPCDRLLQIQFRQPPANISVSCFRDNIFYMVQDLPNPMKSNQSFKVILMAVETGFMIIVNDEVIQKEYPYNLAVMDEYYLYVSEGFPVLEIDINSGIDWMKPL